MAKVTPSQKPEDTAVTVLQQSTAVALQAPSYLTEYQGDKGLSLIDRYVRPPMLKVVQKQADDDLLAKFSIGDVIVMPDRDMLAPWGDKANPRGTAFHATPIFFYPEWICANPIELRGKLPFIRERSLDSRSEVASRCRNRDTWFMQCPEDKSKNIRYSEVLSFVLMVHVPEDHPLFGVPAVLPFSRGEYRFGSKFAGLIRKRKAPHISAAIYELWATGEKRSNDKGQWRGIDADNPTVEGVSPWVEKDVFEQYLVIANAMTLAHKENTLEAEYDDSTIESAPDASAEKRF